MTRVCAALVALMIAASTTHAAGFDSCAAVVRFLRADNTELDSYAIVESYKDAVGFLKQANAESTSRCAPAVTEQTLYEYASSMEDYAEELAAEPETRKKLAGHAAVAYQEYVEWFLALPEDTRETMIRGLTRTEDASEARYRRSRGRWMRERVGGAVRAIARCYVKARTQRAIFSTYDDLWRENVDVFPNEAAKEWYRWLSALPDFARERGEPGIQEMIAAGGEPVDYWASFRDFLGQFVPKNPSVRHQWRPVQMKLAVWLEP